MSNAITTWELKFKDLISNSVQKVQEVVNTASTRVDNLGACFKRLNAIDLQAISQSAQNLNQRFENLNAPFISYESGLAEVSAITGVTGAALDDLGEKARKSAKDFGGEATDSLNTYKTLLSRLGPDIAKSPEALEKMERNVRTLSKTMGNDAAGSVDALTTAMLQYGVDLSDPTAAQEEMTRMMNIMAAGAKEGAAEVPSIAAALKVAGVQAKQSNVSFEETNAVLQALAAGGKEGSEAGVALRNVLGKMAGVDVLPKEAVEKLSRLGVNMNVVSNTSLPLTTRLRELKKAQGDATIMAQMFGTENAAAASIMLNSVDAQDELRSKIVNTNTAQEQAAVMMDTTAEKQSRLNAWYNDAKIAIGEYTAAYSPYVSAGANAISIMADGKNAYEGYKTALSGVKTMLGLTADQSLISAAKTKIVSVAQRVWTGITGLATAAQMGLNAAMTANPIGVIILAIVALIAVVATIINYWDSWGAAMSLLLGPIGIVIGAFKSIYDHWESIKTAFKTDGIIGGLKRIGMVIIDAILKPMQQLFEMVGLDSLAKKIEKFRNDNKLVTKGEKEQNAKEALEAKADQKQTATKKSKVVLDSKTETPGTISLKNLGQTTTDKNTKNAGVTATDGNNVSKSIVQNLTVNNHFGVNGSMDIRKIADEVTGLIIDRLRDGVIQIG
ncbi:phage tail tape measure protein [Flavobacterium sp.]|jgi:TP901 family phage tail tape measure protein|uniref:phage tail tape measure protein n=1 Tax=Flavobacterium sp. TaxID=239 RepID=UPI0037C10CA1